MRRDERTTANGLQHAMAKAWHGEIGEAWTGFGHVSGEARRRMSYGCGRSGDELHDGELGIVRVGAQRRARDVAVGEWNCVGSTSEH